jgi:hypothetical protein
MKTFTGGNINNNFYENIQLSKSSHDLGEFKDSSPAHKSQKNSVDITDKISST